jgi:hypothetical protein
MKFLGDGKDTSDRIGGGLSRWREGVDCVLMAGHHPFLWLALVVIALYGPTVAFDFVDLDDVILIKENIAFLKDLRHIPQVFTQHYFRSEAVAGFYYRPLVTLSFMWDAWIGGGRTWPFHLTNILLHLLAVWGVFSFLWETLGGASWRSRWVAFGGALVFTVHPAQPMAVAWVPGRNDLLLTVFVLASLIGFLRHQRTGSGWAMASHLVFFFLGLLTKETAVAIPVLCGAWRVATAGEGDPGRCRWPAIRDRLLALPWPAWLGLLFLWLLVRGAVLGIPAFVNRSTSLAGRLSLLARYFGKAVLPFDMRLIPTASDASFLWGAGAGLLTLLALRAIPFDRKPIFLYSLMWFTGLLVFAIPYTLPNDLENLGLLEHRLYLPLVGLLIFWAAVLAEGISSDRRWIRFAAAGITLAAMAGGMVRVQRRLPDFRDTESFWTTAVRESPRSDLAAMGLAVVYLNTGRPWEARRELDRTMALNPNRRYLHLNYGVYYLEQKEFDKAEAMFKKEVELFPESLFAYRHLASLMKKQGRLKEAHEWLIRSRMMESAIESQIRTLQPILP